MHPKEHRRIKAGTGRFTHLCLADSEIYTGVEFDGHPAVRSIISDPANYPVLLYPGSEAVNLSRDGFPAGTIGTRRLVVFVLDATWRLARTMFNHNATLRALPRLMFIPSFKSRYVIKKQPHEWCLSTIEAVHELLLLLDRAGMDTYSNPTQMVDLFDRMQQYQIDCENDPQREGGYRRRKSTRKLRESL
jgi:DTW domain-containing protein YfiP